MNEDYYIIGGRGNGKSLMAMKYLLDKAKASSPDYWTTNYYKAMMNAQYGSVINNFKEAEKMNNIAMFKKGDKVQIIRGKHEGKTGCIAKYFELSGGYDIYINDTIGFVYAKEDDIFRVHDDKIKIKVGDKVRVCNKDSTYYNRIGTVVKVVPTAILDLTVHFDSGLIGDSYFNNTEIELIKKEENNMKTTWATTSTSTTMTIPYTYDFKNGSLISINSVPKIKKVIFNCPATIVLFEDGTKSVVKMNEDDLVWDPEHGLAMALIKRIYGTNKSKSNYYDIFKKWLPEEEKKKRDAIHAIKEEMKKFTNLTEETADALVNGTKPITFGEFCQNVKDAGIKEVTSETDTTELLKSKKTKEDISNEIVDATMNGAPKKKLAELVQESKDILDCHRKGFISEFVDKWEATMFPKEFINFCRKHNLYFYIVDTKFGGLKKCNPYEECWQKVSGYLKRGLMEFAMKTPATGTHKDRSYKAVDMRHAVFSRLPKELRNGKNLEKEGGEE